jgi:hypothetical protein
MILTNISLVIVSYSLLLGHSVKVHLMNLAQPVRERRVRDLNTAHVHALSKSFLESPGNE